MNRAHELRILLRTLMRDGDDHEVYEGADSTGKKGDGRFWVTRSRSVSYEPFSMADVEPLLRQGVLVPKWDDAPHLKYYKIWKQP